MANIFKRLKFGIYAAKQYGASFHVDEDGRSHNRNSGEYEGTFRRALESITGTYSDTNLLELFSCVPEIFTPVHAVAFRVASGNWSLRRTKDDALVFDNRDFNKILATPNPLQNFQQLIYEATVFELVTGKNFLYANTPDTLGGGAPNFKYLSTLLNLWPNRVTAEGRFDNGNLRLLTATEVSDLIKEYRLEGYANPIRPDKVLFTHQLSIDSSKGRIDAQSPLQSAKKAIANLIAVYEARNVIYTKRGALGFIVSAKGDASGRVALNKTEKEQLLQEMQKDYGLRRNKSTFGISDAPIDFVRVAMSIAELEPFKETQADALAIAGVLGVDKDLLPLSDGTTFENKKGAERALYQNVAIPRAKSWAQSLTNFLQLEAAGLYLDVSFDHIEVLQANKKEQSEAYRNNVDSSVKLYEKGMITQNMVLVACGQETKPDGDVYIGDVKLNVPLAVQIGVGGTDSLIKVVTDPNLSEDQKVATLILLFSITEEQARALAANANVQQSQQAGQGNNPQNENPNA